MAWSTPATFVSGAILTAAQMNTNVRDNTNAIYDSQKRLAYQTQSSPGTVATVLSGTMNKLFPTSATFTADGTSTYLVEVYVPLSQSATNAGAYNVLHLTDNSGAAVGGALGFGNQADGTRAGLGSFYIRSLYTPSAGSKSLNVGALHAVAAGTIGSSALTQLAYIKVYGPDMT